MKKSIAVLGGGIAGVISANELSKNPLFSIDLIEKETFLGGLQRSIEIEGLVFDVGTFLFWQTHEIFNAFPFLSDLYVVADLTQTVITPQLSLDTYPITVKGYLRDHGLLNFSYSLCDLACSKVLFHKRDTVPAFVKYYMGSTIYKRSGLQNYIERFYGIKDENVGLDFAMQRLEPISNFTAKKVFSKLYNKYRSRFINGKDDKKPLIVVRPPEGFNYVYELIKDSLQSQGVSLSLGCSIKSIKLSGEKFELDFGDYKKVYDRVISTIPIPTMLWLTGMTSDMNFDYMNLYSIFYKGNSKIDSSVLFNFSLEGNWKRITVFSKFYDKFNNQDYLTVEITTRDISQQNLLNLRTDFENHAEKLKLFSGELQYLGESITPYAYPVFHKGNEEKLKLEREKLTKFGIELIGRQGNFQYLSSEETAIRAKELFK